MKFCRPLLILCLAIPLYAFAGIKVKDATGMTVILEKPARRIVSLAPHITEMLYAAGAGSHVVGAVEYSDYPEAAKDIPRVGSGAGLDLEAIVALRPDLIVAWQSGNPTWQVERLRTLGFSIYVTEPRRMQDIAKDIERLGQLAGTSAVADKASRVFLDEYRKLRDRYAQRPKVTVFYQILDPSLMTVNGDHLVSEVIRLCGGYNIFSDLPILASAVGSEAVLQANPKVIVAGGTQSAWRRWRAYWRRWTQLDAVRNNQLYLIRAELIHRHSPRILEGSKILCEALEQSRSERK
ncbi:MAG: cobalamin-binding protein [Gammaproteobacteria bacterium]|nr:MAG: cobalamin-binding protein [Gammaproteobacteria bacterium]